MFIRKYWVLLSVFLVLIVGVSVYYLQTQPPKDPIVIYKTTEVEKPTTEAPVEETQQGGHFHEDGTWHEGPHEAHAPPAAPAVENTAPPGTATKPDFPSVDPNEDLVEAAYKRLEYIKNNPYAWGGVHSKRATELIAQLLPPPVLRDEAHGEAVMLQILDLIAENDPRAAEVLIANMCDGSILSVDMDNGLEAIGPPAVPYILPYLEKGIAEGGYITLPVFESLGRLGARYRGDLGGIVDHIILPKLEVIAADEANEFYEHATVIFAQSALEKLNR